jgi:hypothetical protein
MTRALYEKKVSRAGGLRNRRMRRPCLVSFFVVVAIGTAAAGANAQEPASSPTTWAVAIAPDSRCVDDAEFAAELSAQIPEGQRAAANAAELVATVRVTREGKALAGSIRVQDRVLGSEAGARELSLPLAACAETAEALGLVLAVLVEAGRGAPVVAKPAPVAEAPPASPPPTPKAEEQNVPPPAPRRVPVKRYSWLGPRAGHDILLSAGGGYGLLPGAYLGGNVGWGVRIHQAWPVWLELTGYLPRRTASGRAEFSALYAGVYPCPLHVERRRVRARICPGFSAGALWARGRSFRVKHKDTEVLAQIGLELAGDVQIWGPLRAALTVRPELPLVRQRYVYYRADGGEPELHESRPLTVAAFLGAELRFR